MSKESKIKGLANLGGFLNVFLAKTREKYDSTEKEFYELLLKSEIENPWFTQEMVRSTG